MLLYYETRRTWCCQSQASDWGLHSKVWAQIVLSFVNSHHAIQRTDAVRDWSLKGRRATTTNDRQTDGHTDRRGLTCGWLTNKRNETNDKKRERRELRVTRVKPDQAQLHTAVFLINASLQVFQRRLGKQHRHAKDFSTAAKPLYAARCLTSRRLLDFLYFIIFFHLSCLSLSLSLWPT